MRDVIRVLILEDLPTDAELGRREVRRSLPNTEFLCVENREDFIAALHSFRPDIVLSDYKLPQFDGLSALKLTLEHTPEIPFIIFTGSMNEDTAVECMKAGAWDYVIKEHIKRLGPAVKATLEQKQVCIERRRVEAQLNSTLASHSVTLQAVVDGIISTDYRGRINVFNPAAEKLTGWSRDWAIEKPLEEIFRIVPEETREKLEYTKIRCLNEDPAEGATNHAFLVTKDGTERPIAYSSSLVHDDQGAVTGEVLVFRDRTEERLARQIIETRLSLIEYAVNHTLDDLLIRALDEVGGMVSSPIGFYTFVESDQKTISLQQWSSRTREFCRADDERMFTYIDRPGVWGDCIKEKKPLTYNAYAESPHRKELPDDHTKVVRMLMTPVIRGNKVVAILGVGNKPTEYNQRDVETVSYLADVTWEIVQQKQAAEQSKRFSLMVESSLSEVYTFDVQTLRILDSNQSALKNLGYSMEEMRCMTPLDLKPEFTNESFKRLLAPLISGGRKKIEYTTMHRRKDGTRYPVEIHLQLLITGHPAFVAFVLDITDRMRIEEEKEKLRGQLQQSQKIEALGTLAGGIAHDFNNILGAIMGYTELTLLDIPKEDPKHEQLKNSLIAAGRAKDLIKQILAFSRQSALRLSPIEISPIIKEAIKFIRSTSPTTIEIRHDISQEAYAVMADPIQIHQIVINLCTNAKHAMRDTGGVLEIKLSDIMVDSDFTGLGLAPGHYFKFTVSDTGHGMSQQTMDRIFEPYFTTKEPAEGTGMGLAVVHGIVNSLKGMITVHSEPGTGASFHIYLPIFGEHIDKNSDFKSDPPKGSERILFIDDEEALAELGGRMLKRLGYEVEVFTDSMEALEAFKNSKAKYDLVVTDQTMPKLTGAELAREVLKISPGFPVILCTGFSENVTSENTKELGIKDFLMKPLDIGRFALSIRRALDGRNNRTPGVAYKP